jgi:hypothetical protein
MGYHITGEMQLVPKRGYFPHLTINSKSTETVTQMTDTEEQTETEQPNEVDDLFGGLSEIIGNAIGGFLAGNIDFSQLLGGGPGFPGEMPQDSPDSPGPESPDSPATGEKSPDSPGGSPDSPGQRERIKQILGSGLQALQDFPSDGERIEAQYRDYVDAFYQIGALDDDLRELWLLRLERVQGVLALQGQEEE